TFAIAADGCHTIADVLVDGVSVGAVASYTFSNVQATHTIAASFSIITYTITATAGPAGTIAPNGAAAVNCGSAQPYAITAATCYHVVDVLVDGSSVGAVTSYTFSNVTANHTIAASFAFTTAAVSPVTSLAGAQKKTGNDADGTTKVQLTFTTPAGTSVEV